MEHLSDHELAERINGLQAWFKEYDKMKSERNRLQSKRKTDAVARSLEYYSAQMPLYEEHMEENQNDLIALQQEQERRRSFAQMPSVYEPPSTHIRTMQPPSEYATSSTQQLTSEYASIYPPTESTPEGHTYSMPYPQQPQYPYTSSYPYFPYPLPHQSAAIHTATTSTSPIPHEFYTPVEEELPRATAETQTKGLMNIKEIKELVRKYPELKDTIMSTLLADLIKKGNVTRSDIDVVKNEIRNIESFDRPFIHKSYEFAPIVKKSHLPKSSDIYSKIPPASTFSVKI